MSAKKPSPINYGAMAQTVQMERTAAQTTASGTVPQPKTSEKRAIRDGNIYTVQMTFRVSPKQRDSIKRLALDYHTTVGELIRWFIDSLETGAIQYPDGCMD